MKRVLLNLCLLAASIVLIWFVAEESFYGGMLTFCLYAPAQPGVQAGPAMYYRTECEDMTSQARAAHYFEQSLVAKFIP
jgi:hypothetical protein